ncbi:MAG TPA: type II toxin-antitoxin system death-on-curing family toxin [Roseiflexaceae bacterium]|nr:type II toxin-antitoxin system death-on-curing family toxin [Roseiflexaceae bacterium]
MVYLRLDDLMRIRDHVSLGQGARIEIMNHHQLMAALAAPRQAFFGAEAFPTLAEKAGALVYALVQGHPFWDGNKRIASEALLLFLARNGARLRAGTEDLAAFTREIALGRLRDGDLAQWLAAHIEDQT